MKKYKILFPMVILLALATSSIAQTRPVALELNYNYSIPSGTFKSNTVSNGSPRGFVGSLSYAFSTEWSAGVGYGFQDYYQKYPRQLYHLSDSREISAVLSNSLQVTPIVAEARYYPVTQSGLKPYLSLAAGGEIIDFKQYYGEFSNSSSAFGFRAQGGIGVLIPFRKTGTSGFNLAATYDYAPYNKMGVKNLNSFNVHAGISLDLR